MVGGTRVKASSATVSADENSPYWSCEITLTNANDYGRFPRYATFTVQWFGVEFSMVVDSRSMSRSVDDKGNITNAVSVSGLSPLCLMDNDRSDTVTKTWTEAAFASDIVEEMIGSVTWNLVDWMIPGGRLSVESASRLAVAKQVVEAAGGLIESNPDGSVVIRHKWPIAANQLSTDATATVIGDNRLFSVSEDQVNNTYINRIRILDADASYRDSLEWVQNEDDWSIGELRAYPSPWRGNLSMRTTRGRPPIWLGSQTEKTEQLTEIIEFTEGGASVAKPISQLNSVTWMIESLGGVSFQPYSTELTAAISGYSLAEVVYTTRYLSSQARSDKETTAQFLLEEELP
jgi:hypothetical protein